ncbi:hypothetical protein ADL01_40875 [Streptomyces sp. NRRL WC-3618]|nr:hypothetical protein ADL01_40875 [Streptomyces sp. NRRL WC-3618]
MRAGSLATTNCCWDFSDGEGPTPAEWAHAHGTQMGQPVLLRADGWSVPEVNGFFASARMRNASAGTRRKYAFAVAVWLGFLDAAGRAWHDAGEEDVTGFSSGG